MKKNGFTLIELLGVIVILAVIALITIPVIDRSLNKGKQNLDKAQKEQIIKALKDYYTDTNKSKDLRTLANNGTKCITIKELQDNGNLPDSVRNVLTNGDYDINDVSVCIKKIVGNVDNEVYETNVKYKYCIKFGTTECTEWS